ncbi:MAG: SprT family zinc-dependent metalloprotease [Clostridia bacterium]
MVEYEVKHSKRKTLAIHVTRRATVEVRAPYSVSRERIEGFVKSREAWISRHLGNMEQVVFQEQDAVLLLGREYGILRTGGKKAGFDGQAFHIPETTKPGDVQKAVEHVYRSLAREILSSKSEAFSRILGVSPKGMRITGATTRWGSCSQKGSLNFSWRLIMAEEDLVDYVVIHELAHLARHDHSSAFWKIVERAMPSYREKKKQLRKLQHHPAYRKFL